MSDFDYLPKSSTEVLNFIAVFREFILECLEDPKTVFEEMVKDDDNIFNSMTTILDMDGEPNKMRNSKMLLSAVERETKLFPKFMRALESTGHSILYAFLKDDSPDYQIIKLKNSVIFKCRPFFQGIFQNMLDNCHMLEIRNREKVIDPEMFTAQDRQNTELCTNRIVLNLLLSQDTECVVKLISFAEQFGFDELACNLKRVHSEHKNRANNLDNNQSCQQTSTRIKSGYCIPDSAASPISESPTCASIPSITTTFPAPKVSRSQHPYHSNPANMTPYSPELYPYQEELLGQMMRASGNKLLQCETNSGKTRVVISYLFHVINSISPNAKFVYLTSSGPLRDQQFERFEEFFAPNTVKKVAGSDGSEERTVLCPRTDKVLIMTAQSFLNELSRTRPRFRLVDFAVIVLDECHHANGDHPYNQVMKTYFDHRQSASNQDNQQTVNVPQIIGISASPSANAVAIRSQEDAVTCLKTLLFNLDCDHLIRVRSETGDLLSKCPVPEDEILLLGSTGTLRCAERDLSDGVKAFVRLAISAIYVTEKGSPEILAILHRILETQDYVPPQEMISELKNCPGISDQAEIVRFIAQETADALIFLAFLISEIEGLSVNLVCSELAVLKNQLLERKNNKELEGTSFLSFLGAMAGIIDGISTKFGGRSGETGNVLPALENIILSYGQSKTVVFVKTRRMCKILWDWASSHVVLSTLNPQFIHADLTREEQNSALAAFRYESSSLIFATPVIEEGIDIPDCNAAVLFNFVPTHIQLLQQRGRARRPGSKYFMLVSNQLMQQEVHQHLDRLVHAANALREIQSWMEESAGEFTREKLLYQQQSSYEHRIQVDSYQRQVEANRGHLFEFKCGHCEELFFNNNQVFKYGQSLFPVISRGFSDATLTRERLQQVVKVGQGLKRTDELHCKSCGLTCVGYLLRGEMDLFVPNIRDKKRSLGFHHSPRNCPRCTLAVSPAVSPEYQTYYKSWKQIPIIPEKKTKRQLQDLMRREFPR